jgi:hypothetical protein
MEQGKHAILGDRVALTILASCYGTFSIFNRSSGYDWWVFFQTILCGLYQTMVSYFLNGLGPIKVWAFVMHLLCYKRIQI